MNKLAHSALLSAAPTPQRRRTDRLIDAASRIKNALLRMGASSQNGAGQDRISSRIQLTQAPDAVSAIVGDCTRDLGSREQGKRDEARAILVQLAVKKGHEGARKALESNLTTAIWDFDLQTLIFLGKYADPRTAAAVDTSLEHNMDRLETGMHLNTLTYIAAKSSCSIGARRHAAVILANQERRADNLAYVQRHTSDLEIRALMTAALEDRLHHK